MNMTIYWVCAGICLTVITISAVVVFISISKVKKESAKLVIERQKLELEKSDFLLKENQLKRAQENLKNAQILFQKEKETQNNLLKKSEKEIAIDLFLKFSEMETVFGYMKNNLASIDLKLLGVKDYSEGLDSMKTEVSGHLDSLKVEMTAMQEHYSMSLSSVYNGLETSLANIETRIEGIVSSITEKEMAGLAKTVSEKLASLAGEFGAEMEGKMLDEDDLVSAVERALILRNVSSLDENDIEDAVKSAIFPYSIDFASEIKAAVEDAISSSRY